MWIGVLIHSLPLISCSLHHSLTLPRNGYGCFIPVVLSLSMLTEGGGCQVSSISSTTTPLAVTRCESPCRRHVKPGTDFVFAAATTWSAHDIEPAIFFRLIKRHPQDPYNEQHKSRLSHELIGGAAGVSDSYTRRMRLCACCSYRPHPVL
jgi:hypothetical protein